MTRPITPEEAQLARVAWVIHQGAKAAGIDVSNQTAQRLAMSCHRVMLDNGIYFEYQSHIDDAVAAMEG